MILYNFDHGYVKYGHHEGLGLWMMVFNYKDELVKMMNETQNPRERIAKYLYNLGAVEYERD